MPRTFLVNLEITPNDDPAAIADDLADLISSEGYTVNSVKPWSEQGQALMQGNLQPFTLDGQSNNSF